MNNSPLRIMAPAALPGLGLSICPGKKDPHAHSGPCARDLNGDIAAIKAWGASMVVSLLEPFELRLLHVENLGEAVKAARMEWRHWPVIDQSPLAVRGKRGQDPWPDQCSEFLHRLERGEKIFVHCRGDLGRTGTLAARLLIENGLEPAEAIIQVRVARPGAIETMAQEEYLLGRAWEM